MREPMASLPRGWRARIRRCRDRGEDEQAEALLKAASAPYAVNLSVVHLTDSEAVAQNLPPALAETIPQPAGTERKEIGRGSLHQFLLPPAHRRPRRAFDSAARSDRRQ